MFATRCKKANVLPFWRQLEGLPAAIKEFYLFADWRSGQGRRNKVNNQP